MNAAKGEVKKNYGKRVLSTYLRVSGEDLHGMYEMDVKMSSFEKQSRISYS